MFLFRGGGGLLIISSLPLLSFWEWCPALLIIASWFCPDDDVSRWCCTYSPCGVVFEWLYILLLFCFFRSFSLFPFPFLSFFYVVALLPHEDIVHSKCGGEATGLEAISLKKKENLFIVWIFVRSVLSWLTLISCALMWVCVWALAYGRL